MSSIFLVHSDKDNYFANKLGRKLKRDGYYVWIDEAEMQIGDSLIERIENGIEKMKYVGVVISCNSIKSHLVKKEINLAMHQEIKEKEIRVLPMLLDTVKLPGFLKDKFYVDFRNGKLFQKSY